MAQGKLKVKAQLPKNAKNKKGQKGAAVTKRANKPIQPKKNKFEEAHKLKKIITKTVNKAVEAEIRQRALGEKPVLTNAQKAVAEHNSQAASTSS